MRDADAAELATFIRHHPRLFVLTGAGISTASGIPDYRDAHGQWKRPPPMTLQAFLATPAARQRYWARSYVGWAMMGQARPNAAHRALADLQRAGWVSQLLTQNVDGLHDAAGSWGVIDLHGRIDTVVCLACGARTPRAVLQQRLGEANPGWLARPLTFAPDGDADLAEADIAGFCVPACGDCGGLLKPDVVFFGEQVPRGRVQAGFDALERSDAVLVVGSSLMVWSGLRFVEAAHRAGLPVAALNLGRTRADALLAVKIEAGATDVLPRLPALLPPSGQRHHGDAQSPLGF